MTVTVLAPLPAAHPAAGVLSRVHGLLDELQTVLADTDVDASDLAGLLGSCNRATSRLAAVQLGLVASAERTSIARDAGLPSTGAWVAKVTRSDPAATSRTARLATALDSLGEAGTELANTRSALSSGEVSLAHAAVIADALGKLPSGLTPEQTKSVESDLVERARTVDPATLRRQARRALAAVEPDSDVVDAHQDQLVRDEEVTARAKSRLTLHDNGDGTTTGHFTVPTMAASILRKVIHAIASPRRARLGATDAQAGVDQRLDGDWSHRHGLALIEMLEHLPTDHLHGSVAATILVTIDEQTLRSRVKAAGLDTGDDISAGEARRLACSAGILPAVLASASVPVDLGRKTRFFTATQQAAASLAWDSCAADGCDRPLAWSEWHHEIPWSHGGNTDLHNAIPLCGWHHQRIHDPTYEHRWAHDRRRITFHRRA